MYVGKEVILSGEIMDSPDPVKYTYLLKLNSNEEVGLVSTKTAIGNYSGKVSVKGTVKSYDDNMYVIDVSFITTDTSANLSANDSTSKTYFASANMLVDVSNHPSPLSVSEENSVITISDTASSQSGDIIAINYFTCQKSDPLKDCQQIQASANAGDQFTNTQGVTFYKLAEAGKRFAVNENMGYMVSVPKDAFFYKVSSYLFPINSKYIQGRISAQATNYCYNSTSRLGNISNQTTTVKGNTWSTVVAGTDTDGKQITCTLDMTFSDHSENISLSSYIISNEGSNTATGSTTTPGSTNGGEQPTTPTTVGAVPGPTSTGYLFVSNRGNYSIFFPSQKISFEGVNLNEDFGLSNTDCYVDIQVKSYADMDNASVAPGVEIYECVTRQSIDEIKSALRHLYFLE